MLLGKHNRPKRTIVVKPLFDDQCALKLDHRAKQRAYRVCICSRAQDDWEE